MRMVFPVSIEFASPYRTYSYFMHAASNAEINKFKKEIKQDALMAYKEWGHEHGKSVDGRQCSAVVFKSIRKSKRVRSGWEYKAAF